MSSILDIYGKRKIKRKEPQLMADENPVPNFVQRNGVVTPTRPSVRSERAAEAARQWEEIENELRDQKARYEMDLNALRTENYELKGRLASVEKANEILNVDVEALRVQGEANRTKLDAYRAKLEVAARIILDLASEEARPNLTKEQDDKALQAIEDAMLERGTAIG